MKNRFSMNTWHFRLIKTTKRFAYAFLMEIWNVVSVGIWSGGCTATQLSYPISRENWFYSFAVKLYRMLFRVFELNGWIRFVYEQWTWYVICIMQSQKYDMQFILLLTIDDMQYDGNIWAIWWAACIVAGILLLDGRYNQRADLNEMHQHYNCKSSMSPQNIISTTRTPRETNSTHRFAWTQMTCFGLAHIIIVLELMRYLCLPLSRIVGNYLLQAMIPNDIQWWINGTTDNAMQCNATTFLHIANGIADGFRFRNCKRYSKHGIGYLFKMKNKMAQLIEC